MKAWPTTYLPPIQVDKIPTLNLFNSLTRTKEPVKESQVSMYVCGITPYDATHLGHAATYLTFDIINRYLKFAGQSVHYVENITDVDDPLLERAQRDGVDWRVLAEEQISLFRDDMTSLRVLPPDQYMGAVETIPWVIEAIEQMKVLAKNSVYEIDGDLYFDVTADPHFDSYNKLTLEEKVKIFAERGGDPARPGKRHPLDCLIWRAQQDSENEPAWPSPFGLGRPGWHIECTAIALKYLEAPISIQGGGSDLHFPHHTMCAAEGRVLTGKDFARKFVHAGMIGLDGEKMSKSKGNLKFVSKMRNDGIDPLLIRVALLSGHYREDRPWSDALLTQTKERVELWRKAISSPYGGNVDALIEKVSTHLSDDLDTPGAFMAIDRWANERINTLATELDQSVSNVGRLSRYLDAVLGVTF